MLGRHPLEAAKQMRAYLETKPTPELIKLAVACRHGIAQNGTDKEACRAGLDFVRESLGMRLVDSKFEGSCSKVGVA